MVSCIQENIHIVLTMENLILPYCVVFLKITNCLSGFHWFGFIFKSFSTILDYPTKSSGLLEAVITLLILKSYTFILTDWLILYNHSTINWSNPNNDHKTLCLSPIIFTMRNCVCTDCIICTSGGKQSKKLF